MKNQFKKQLKEFNLNEDINLNETLEFIDSELSELHSLLKKLENEEELDKEIIKNIFEKYNTLLQIHKHIYASANHMLLDENMVKKDILYGYG